MTDQSKWNQFLIQEKGSFLQSWEWGTFQENLGKKTWRFQIGREKTLGQALVIKENLPFHLSFLYVPFGPTLAVSLSPSERREVWQALLRKIQAVGKKEKAFAIKIEPFKPFGFELPEAKKSLKRIQPQKTLVLNLQKPLEVLFKNFSVRSRYNIRLAQRKGVKIIHLADNLPQNDNYFSKFTDFVTQTAQRKSFHAYPKAYYKKLLKQSLSEKWGELFLAEYQKKIIGGYLIIFFAQQAACLHGAVGYQYRALKASHLLQWEQIKAAKKRGARIYDFWGVDEKLWPGVTFFKKSFGGTTLTYPSGLDIPLSRFIFSTYSWYQKLKKR